MINFVGRMRRKYFQTGIRLLMAVGLLLLPGLALSQTGLDVDVVMSDIAEDLVGVNVYDWLDVFSVTVTNNEAGPVQYRVIFSLVLTNSSVASGEVASGYTRLGTEKYDGVNGAGVLAASSEITLDKSNYRLGHLFVDPNFNEVLVKSGVLPAGDYEIDIRVQVDEFGDGEELYFVNINDPNVQTVTLPIIERSVTLPSPPVLSLPSDQTIVNQGNPTFTWLSINAAPGVKVRYKISICERENGQSYEEAMDNLTFWTNNWGGLNIYGDDPVPGTGSQVNINWTYPSEADDFQAGREYVWQVIAYDVDHVYNWDEQNPALSEIWAFYFGSPPTLLRPANNSRDIATVRPTFGWSSVQGTYDYEIWISDKEDPDVEAPFWDAVVTSPSYRYPEDAPALVPGGNQTYYWKVRTNPSEVTPGEWSTPVFNFGISALALVNPRHDAIESTIRPSFVWRSPADVPAFELRISGAEDATIDNPFYSEVVTFPPFIYPSDAPPLQPGALYHWTILRLDQNEEVVGEPDDYPVFRFRVQNTELNLPAEGANLITLSPTFSWDAAAEIPNFELQIASEDDPLFEHPVFTVVTQSRTFQYVGDVTALIPGKNYFWRIVALDAGEVVIGEYTDYIIRNVFHVQPVDLLLPQNDEIVNTCRPFFSWKALQGMSNFELRLGGPDDPNVESPLATIAVSGTEHLMYPADAEFELCCNELQKTFYWTVICLDDENNPIGDAADYQRSVFSIRNMALLEPQDGVTLTTLTPTFTWEAPQNQSAASIRFSGEEDSRVETPFASVIVPGQSYTPQSGQIDFGPGHFYFWTVYPADRSNNECPLSNARIRSFRMPELRIIAPAGNEVDNAHPQFQWEVMAGITGYEVMLIDETRAVEVFKEQVSSSPYNSPVALGPGNRYSWQVQALNNSGDPIGDASDPAAFTVQPIELLAPISNSVLMPSVVSSIQPVFRWRAPTGLNQFKLTVIVAESDQILYENSGIYGISFRYPKDAPPLEYDRGYRWRLQAVVEDQLVGQLSEQNSFRTPTQPEVQPPAIHSVTFQSITTAPTVETELAAQSDHYTLLFSWNAEMTDLFQQADNLTTSTYIYPPDATPIPWAASFYVRAQAFDAANNPFGNPVSVSDVYAATAPAAALQPAPVLTVEIPVNTPLLPVFSWSNISGAERYRLLVSAFEEIDERAILANPLADLFVTGSRFEWTTDQPALAYSTPYVAQVIGYKQEPVSLPCQPVNFTTGAVPGASDKPVFNVVFENPDPRVPTFYQATTVAGANNYRLSVSATEDMTDIVWTSNALDNFPYRYPDDAPGLRYDTPYFLQSQGYIDDAPHGLNSEVMPFRTGSQPGADEQPGFDVRIAEGDPLAPVFQITVRVTNATDYQFTVSRNNDFSDIIWTSDGVSAFPFTYPASAPALNYNTVYFSRAQGYSEGNPHGLLSNTVPFTTGPEPGSNESPELSVIFNNDPLLPRFNLTRPVTGADAYVITVARDVALSDVLWESAAVNQFPYPYPGDPALEHGGIYYARTSAFKNSQPHGLPGRITLFQIPQMTRPVLLESPLFSWNPTDPAGVRYDLKVSLLEDMSSRAWTQSANVTHIDYPDDVFAWSTTYYWQVESFDGGGERIGSPSAVGYFVTPSIEPPNPTAPVDVEIETPYPNFSWSPVTQAARYRIQLSDSPDLSVIFWSSEPATAGVRYPEDALHLSAQTNYYWQVEALDSDGDRIGEASRIVSFRIAQLPQVRLNSPVNEAVSSLTPTFRWNRPGNANRYRIVIGTPENLANVLFEQVVTTNELTYPGSPALQDGSLYFWQVTIVDASDNVIGRPSQTASFSTPAPEGIMLTSPVDVTIDDLQPQFTWSRMTGADSYMIELILNDETIWTRTVNNNQAQLPGSQRLSNGQSYTWNVQSIDRDANPIGNRPSAGFQTRALQKVTLSSPLNIEISTTTPNFQWEVLPDVPGYRIEVSDNADFNSLWSAATAQNHIGYPGDPALQFNVEYFWRVIALDQNSNPVGEWSDPGSFRITNRFIINLVSPVSTAVYTLSPMFTWQANENVARYKIRVAADNGFSDILWSMDEIRSGQVQYPSIGVPSLAYGSTYYWDVQALAEDGSSLGDPCASASFPVSGVRVPEPIAPVEVQVETLNPNFSWTEVTGAAKYTLIVAKDENLSEITYQNANIADLGITYPASGAIPLEFAKTYYWRVQAFDNEGNPVGDPSPVVRFATPTSMLEIILEFGP